MKLEKLRELAEARTGGEWRQDDGYVYGPSYTIVQHTTRPDAAFIAALANHADALLDVTYAARMYVGHLEFPTLEGDYLNLLEEALAKLEAIK